MTTLRLARVSRCTRGWAQKEPLLGGRSCARGTGAATEGGEGVGGLHKSEDGRELADTETHPSKGGPCESELQEGPRPDALTSAPLSAALLKIAARASHWGA